MNRTVLIFMLMVTAVMPFAVAQTPNIKIRDASSFDFYNEDSYFVSQSPDPAEPGGYVELRWKVENLGSSETDNLLFELLPKYPFSLEPGDSARKSIGSLSERQVGENAYILYYRVKIDENAVEGDNEIELRYSTDNGASWVRDEPFTVRVRAHDVILSVSDVTISPTMLAAGDTADVKIKIQNVAPTQAKNLKVTLGLITQVTTSTGLSTTELPFTPVGSTNEKVVRLLDSGEEVTVQYSLAVDPEAAAKVYKIPLTIAYQDDLGNDFTTNSVIGLLVSAEPDVTVTLDDSTIDGAGMKGEITFKFVNKGVADVKFLDVILEESSAYQILTSNDYYIGNVDSDDYETANFEIYVEQTSEQFVEFPISITYLDANNQEYSQDTVLKLRIYSADERKLLGLTNGGNNMIWIVVLVVVVAGFFFYRWRKKRKK